MAQVSVRPSISSKSLARLNAPTGRVLDYAKKYAGIDTSQYSNLANVSRGNNVASTNLSPLLATSAELQSTLNRERQRQQRLLNPPPTTGGGGGGTEAGGGGGGDKTKTETGGGGGGGGGTTSGTSTLNSLYAAKLKAIADALGSAKQASLASLAEQRAAVSPLFEAQRGGLQAASAAQARNFAEYMANRGLASSGESAQARLMQGTALQSGLTQLGSQEAATLANIEKEKSRIETDYQNKLAQAKTQNQIEKLTQRYNEQQAQLAAASQSSQVQQFDKLSNFGKNTYARTENMLNSGMTPDEIITFLDNQRKNGYITSDEMDYIASQFGI